MKRKGVDVDAPEFSPSAWPYASRVDCIEQKSRERDLWPRHAACEVRTTYDNWQLSISHDVVELLRVWQEDFDAWRSIGRRWRVEDVDERTYADMFDVRDNRAFHSGSLMPHPTLGTKHEKVLWRRVQLDRWRGVCGAFLPDALLWLIGSFLSSSLNWHNAVPLLRIHRTRR